MLEPSVSLLNPSKENLNPYNELLDELEAETKSERQKVIPTLPTIKGLQKNKNCLNHNYRQKLRMKV